MVPREAWRTALWMWHLLLLVGFAFELIVFRFSWAVPGPAWWEALRMPALYALIALSVVAVVLSVVMWFHPGRTLAGVCMAVSVCQGLLFVIVSGAEAFGFWVVLGAVLFTVGGAALARGAADQGGIPRRADEIEVTR